MKPILVTSALPYANGPLHLGHILECIQTDIWARYQRLRQRECHYVCADDAHGTAIMLKAEETGQTAEQLIARVNAEHQRDFQDFQIAFDHFSTTHSDENRHYSELFYEHCVARGRILKRKVTGAYDPERAMFLSDRLIKGACPRCGATDQYGDNCEACGAQYDAGELRDPKSTLSGATPQRRETEHLFFDLPQCAQALEEWLQNSSLQAPVRNKLREWLKAGLKPWDISRDPPYFGFTIPGHADQFFYVWLDAPIGYVASFHQLCQKRGIEFDEFFGPDASAELLHVIGKDIINFHGLFWPALLDAVGWRKPRGLHAHGFLTVDGAKMSKSQGTYITARQYLDCLHPEYLRYYFACKLNDKVEDIDFSADDMAQRINADLVGKIVNIASRCARFINRDFGHRLDDASDSSGLHGHFVSAGDSIGDAYQAFQYSRAMREISGLADLANQYIDEHKPWNLAKQDPHARQIQQVCSAGLNLFRLLALYLAPALPQFAQRCERLLNCPLNDWDEREKWLAGTQIRPFEPLLKRIEKSSTAELKP